MYDFEVIMGIQAMALSVVYGVLSAVGVIANLTVLVLILLCPQLRSLTQAIIFNLSLADFVYSLSLPFVISWTINQDWIVGEMWCKIVFCSESTCKHASMLFIMMMSADRYLALCQGPWWKPRRTAKLFAMITCGTWVMVSVLMIPIYMYSRTVTHANRTMCTIQWNPPYTYTMENSTLVELKSRLNASELVKQIDAIIKRDIYEAHKTRKANLFTVLTFTFMFCIPAIVILYCSCRCLIKLFKARDRAYRMRKASIAKSYQRVSHLVITLASFYLCCWTPLWGYTLLTMIKPDYYPSPFMRQILSASHVLPYLNAAVNPCLYALVSQHFRQVVMSCVRSTVYKYRPEQHPLNRRKFGRDHLHSDEYTITPHLMYSLSTIRHLSIRTRLIGGHTPTSSPPNPSHKAMRTVPSRDIADMDYQEGDQFL